MGEMTDHRRLSLICRMAGNVGGPLILRAVLELEKSGDAELFASRFKEMSELSVGFAMQLLKEAEKALATQEEK